MKEKIEQVNRYIKENRHRVNHCYRGKFHLLPPIGWMNDPNGFVYYKNEYHLFYQFYPYDSLWGPMHWGHAKSKDLIHWEELPVALAPSEVYDRNGCFSGSAIVIDDKLVLIYTGHVEEGNVRTETQCMAVSHDGIHFEKYAGNPVIGEKHINGIADIADFRDPKIMKYDNHYYTVVASKTEDNRGQILLFESDNCFDWRFKSVLLVGKEDQGIMWECPDLFELDGKWVLIMSPIEMERKGNQYWNLNSTLAFIGGVDWESGYFQVENFHEIDGGLDFYAPQTCVNDKGERYLVAWQQMWHRNIPTHDLNHGWAGMMTIPRKLSIKNNRLYQEIPETLTSQLTIQERFSGQVDQSELVFSSAVKQQQYLILELEKPEDFELIYARNVINQQGVKISYNENNQVLSLGRERLGHKIIGKEEPYADIRHLNISDPPKSLTLEILRDINSIELFVNGQTMSMTFYEKEFGTDIVLTNADKLNIKTLEFYDIA